jgi:predicted anti-sigma-YlaC factor YlaD
MTDTYAGKGQICGKPFIRLLLFLCLMMFNGCAVREYAINRVGDAVAGGGDSFASDNDPDLIRDASPFSLKMMEGLLAENPRHRGLLLAATKGFTQYAYAYVQQQADEMEATDVATAYAERDRAKRLYLRARDYGLRGLSLQQPDFFVQLRADPQAAVKKVKPEDVALLYWTGAAWAAAIAAGKDDPFLVADLPAVEALILRACEIDETYDNGALHVFLISYEMSRSAVSKDAVHKAREHFKRAVELSGGFQAAPYVALAEAVTVQERQHDEFTKLLNQALTIDIDKRPDWRLSNLIMQRRARWLLAHTDEYFLE